MYSSWGKTELVTKYSGSLEEFGMGEGHPQSVAGGRTWVGLWAVAMDIDENGLYAEFRSLEMGLLVSGCMLEFFF